MSKNHFREVTKKIELLPCPFCGCEATLRKSEETQLYHVACFECGCRQDASYKEERAIEAWNIRKHMERIVKQLEELPHGKYIDDYGTGFSNAVNAAIEIVQKGGAE